MMPESQRHHHEVAPVQQWLRYQEWELPQGEDERTAMRLLRETQARFERNTGMLVPPEYRVESAIAEPWPLAPVSPWKSAQPSAICEDPDCPALEHPEDLHSHETCPPRDGHDMEAVPLVLTEDPSEPTAFAYTPDEACDLGQPGGDCAECQTREHVRESLGLLLEAVLLRHSNSCLDDGSDFDRLKADLLDTLMEVLA